MSQSIKKALLKPLGRASFCWRFRSMPETCWYGNVLMINNPYKMNVYSNIIIKYMYICQRYSKSLFYIYLLTYHPDWSMKFITFCYLTKLNLVVLGMSMHWWFLVQVVQSQQFRNDFLVCLRASSTYKMPNIYFI